MNRSDLFDNIKVLLIFSVVLAHYIRVSGFFHMDSPAGVIYITAFSFIMQGFFFVSGFFSKNVDKCRQGAVKNFLLPYIIMMPAMYLVRLAVFGEAHINFMRPTHGLWFLLAMFVYRFFIKDLSRIPDIKAGRFTIPSLPVIGIILYFASGCFVWDQEFLASGRILSFFLFFAVGFSMNQSHIDMIRRIPKPVTALMAAGLMMFLYNAAYSRKLPADVWHLKEAYETGGFDIAEGLMIRGILLALSLAWVTVFISLVPEKKIFCSDIGRNTMTVYIFHLPIRYMIKQWSMPFGGGLLSYIVTILISAGVVYLFSRPAVYNFYAKSIDAIYNGLMVIWARLWSFLHRCLRLKS